MATVQVLDRRISELRHEDSTCLVRLYSPGPGLYVTHVYGCLSAEGALAISGFGNRVIASDASIRMFHDWGGVTSYESFARKHLTAWAINQRAHFVDVTFVVRSKLIAAGIATANLATRAVGVPLHTVDNRGAFHAALQQAMRAATPSANEVRALRTQVSQDVD